MDLYKSQGIDRIVALRGDLPSGQVGPVTAHAQDLVRFIREHSGDHFHIEVAAYPEMHPQADSFDGDIQRFVEKVNAGANAGITQFFFNPDAYFYFIERIAKAGVIFCCTRHYADYQRKQPDPLCGWNCRNSTLDSQTTCWLW